MVAQIKKFKKLSPFIFEFCFWEDPPHPVNWSPTLDITVQQSSLMKNLPRVGDQLTGWGGSSKKQSSKKSGLRFFEISWFERPLLRYLLKSVLHRAALLHCLGLLAAVSQWYIVPTIWGYMSDRGPKDMGTGLEIWIYCHQFGNIYASWFYIFDRLYFNNQTVQSIQS